MAASPPRERAVAPIDVPAGLRPRLDGRRWARNMVGEAGATVHRLHAPGRPELFLKHGVGATAQDVADESARLHWAAPRFPTAEPAAFVSEGGEAWLLTTAVPGRTAHQRLEEEPTRGAEIAAALGAFLRRVHALPVETCPFDARHPSRMAHARTRLKAGLVDEADFNDQHQGQTAAEVWRELLTLKLTAVDEVVTHGDFSLNNVLLNGAGVTGCIDLGRLGVADPHQDLAIMCSNLDDFGPGLRTAFLTAYGLPAPDERRMRFHLCLDEFF